ncbi:ATP-binding cassette domain-containing protein, partial [Bdellovibrionota bacterium FG-2]
KIRALSVQYGLEVDLNAKIEDLPVGIQQRVEILKLLYRDARILIFDEPTAVLTPQEARSLFANLKKLKSEGKTCILITHKLKEVMDASDRVTIFRAGAVVGEVETAQTSVDELASLMVGRKVNLRPTRAEPLSAGGAHQTAESVLRVKGLNLKSHALKAALGDLSFDVAPGEIVGIAGIEGNGQSELLQVLLHPQEFKKRVSGEVSWLGIQSLKAGNSLTNLEIRELGVGCIPEDRHRDAVLLNRPVLESFLLGFQRRERFKKGPFIDFDGLKKAVTKAFETFDIRPRATHLEMSKFSGGNQQKLVIAREFEFSPRALIAAHPTRGVDVGAIEFIHSKILQARQMGVGVLLVSSELDEILALSDRILVLYEGRIVSEFRHEEFSSGQVTEMDLGRCMTGVAQ